MGTRKNILDRYLEDIYKSDYYVQKAERKYARLTHEDCEDIRQIAAVAFAGWYRKNSRQRRQQGRPIEWTDCGRVFQCIWRRKASNYWRAVRKTKRAELSLEAKSPDGELLIQDERAISPARCAELSYILAGLDPRQRAMVWERLEGFTMVETAARLGLSTRTLRREWSRIRSGLAA